MLHVAPTEFCVVPRGVKFRVECRGTVARLRLRELRRALSPTRARADRHERPRERARFPVAGRSVRGARRRLPRRRQILGQAVGGEDRPLAARHRRVARHLRALQVRPEALQHDQHGHLRPPGSVDLHACSPRRPRRPEPRTSTSALIADRWSVAENTFRPPPFHRNVCSEFVGLVQGRYIGKAEGFAPGCASLHNCMSGHGPDDDAFEAGSKAANAPQYLADTLDDHFRDAARHQADALRARDGAARARLLQALAGA